MNIFKKWINRLKRVYLIVELDEQGREIQSFYFKKNKNRMFVFHTLWRNECEPHYSMWCELRDFDADSIDNWLQYLEVVEPNTNLILAKTKIPVSSSIYKNYLYEVETKRIERRLREIEKKRGYKISDEEALKELQHQTREEQKKDFTELFEKLNEIISEIESSQSKDDE